MQKLKFFAQQLEQWRHSGSSPLLSRVPAVKELDQMGAAADKPPPLPDKNRRSRQARHKQLVWVLAVASLTGTMGQRFYNQPTLAVSTKAPQTIIAPAEANIVDEYTTERKRQEARRGFSSVLKIDRELTQDISEEIGQILNQSEEWRAIAGNFPFVKPAVLSINSQLYLRGCTEAEWLALKNLLAGTNPAADLSANPAFSQAASELKAYRQSNSASAMANLTDAISLSRQRYATAKDRIAQLPAAEASRYESVLWELSNEEWQATRAGIELAAERILTQGIPSGLPPNILESAIAIQINSLVPAKAKAWAVQLLLSNLKSNLVEDKEQTKQRAERAALAIPPEIIKVKQGEPIVYAGEVISQRNFAVLDYFKLSRRGVNWWGLLGFGTLVSSAAVLFLLVENRANQNCQGANGCLRRRDNVLVLLLTLSTPILISAGIPYTNLPAVGLLAGSFYGGSIAIAIVGLIAVLGATGMGFGWEYWLVGAAGGILSSLMAEKMRSREELALLGLTIGLTQGGICLLGNLLLSGAAGAVWYFIFKDAAMCALSGVAWSIVALGLSPYLEHLFDLITPIRLAELANPNRPLLQRLAAETPGTFQHTLAVATLAEAAAKALGCNVELVRAGTLYHDIGKMHDPLGFIENQMGGANKHDQINDPWRSAEIIKKHVTEGLVMARKHRLPKAIQAFIPEHQGTILIAYFYYQAQQIVSHPEVASEQPLPQVNESDFRYAGPIPQSRETAIVMLADGCEAALRSLKNASSEEAVSTINKILRARWQDDQLLDSGLTREDLSVIADVFLQVWQQSNHQRIAYPKSALSPR